MSSCIDSCIYSTWTSTFTNGQNSLWKYETPSTWYVNSSTIKLVLAQVNISQTLEKTRTGTERGFVVSIRTLSDRVVRKLYKSSVIWKKAIPKQQNNKRLPIRAYRKGDWHSFISSLLFILKHFSIIRYKYGMCRYQNLMKA